MQEAVINAEERAETGTRACRRLRRRGVIPGIVYGHGEEGIRISMDAHDLVKTLHGGAYIYDLKIPGRQDEKVLVKDIRYDSLGSEIVHVDLQRVALTEKVEVTVPIVLVGQAIGVVHKGIIDQPLKDLRVVCLPTQIPRDLRLIVTGLDIGQMLTVKDIKLPEGVATTSPPDQTVVTVHPPMAEEVAEVAAEAVEAGAAEPEVIGAAKGEEEEEAEEDEEGKPKTKEKEKEKEKDRDKEKKSGK